MGKYDDYGVPLTKREMVNVVLIAGAAFTCWIAAVCFAVLKFFQLV